MKKFSFTCRCVFRIILEVSHQIRSGKQSYLAWASCCCRVIGDMRHRGDLWRECNGMMLSMVVSEKQTEFINALNVTSIMLQLHEFPSTDNEIRDKRRHREIHSVYCDAKNFKGQSLWGLVGMMGLWSWYIGHMPWRNYGPFVSSVFVAACHDTNYNNKSIWHFLIR